MSVPGFDPSVGAKSAVHQLAAQMANHVNAKPALRSKRIAAPTIKPLTPPKLSILPRIGIRRP